MSEKIKVGLIFGGASPEHEVSKMTAKSILDHIDLELFDVTEIYIDKNGKFDESLLSSIDVAFLAVHGPNCEDGKLQQFLEDRKIRYTGPGVEASRINMDKVLMHESFKKAGLPTVEFHSFNKSTLNQIDDYIKKIELPIFIKPNNAGSSIGISRVKDIDNLQTAIYEAFNYDDQICIEKAVDNPREIELAVLGNDDLIISNPGEVISHGEFYSYETKYFKPFETTTESKLTQNQIDELKDLAQKAYTATGCRGYSRVDFLLGSGKIYLNEINTLPGFTSISMFPKLMEAVGIDYKTLITRIINLALQD